MGLQAALANLDDIGTPACKPWREKIILRRRELGTLLCNQYRSIAKRKTYIDANRWLGQIERELKLAQTGLYYDSGEEQLRDYAIAKAHNLHKEIYDLVDKVGKQIAIQVMRQRVALMGIELPLPEHYTQDQVVAAMARVVDPKWLFRKLRKIQWRGLEQFIRGYGGVGVHRDLYVSDASLHRRQRQRARNKALMECLEAENEQGQTFTLAELAALSPSNPIVRRAELMVRARGFEDFANQSGDFVGLFFTLTCPSKYHARLHSGAANPKYNGSSPLDAHDYLNGVWQLTRSAWDREGIAAFGMRTVEPHHDGTPHWHLLLFVHKDRAAVAQRIFEHYALTEDGDEPGAQKNRIKTVTIDPAKGSATGYIAKYIAKNIDGHNVGADTYGRDAVESAARIEAWASIWGIRQFQQIGGASVTVWRELRRLEAEHVDQSLLAAATRAADEGNWAEYTRLMGGAICPRKDRPLRPMMLPQKEPGQYGEIIKKLKGLWFGPQGITTRIHEWTVRLLANSREDAEPDCESFAFGVALNQAPPHGGVTLEFCQ